MTSAPAAGPTAVPGEQVACDMFIAGEWTPAASGETVAASSPVNGAVIGSVAQGDRGDAQRAIEAARGAAAGWARLTAFERAARMHAVGDLIESRRDELARTLTLDQGKPLHAEAYDEVAELVEYWRMAAEDAKRLGGELPNSISAGKRVMLVRRPRGAVGVISPWNWPYTMPAELLAPALACGNTVVWTPAPSTAVCAQALARCIVDADLPPGVFNLATGPGPVVGDEIARNPGLPGIAFIGSTATGNLVAGAAAGKAALLEMGGNGPLVVMDDANVAAAVEATLVACYLCAGQSCTAGERILVQRGAHDEYVELLGRAVSERIRLGDPFAPDDHDGPAEQRAGRLEDGRARRRRARARRHAGLRRRAGERARHRPVLATDRPRRRAERRARGHGGDLRTDRAGRGSIDSLEQAIELTNASPYGLLSAIFTADLAAGLRFAESVRTGWVNINESTNYWEAHLPFGGRAGTGSGIGRVGGAHVMHSFTELQTVVVSESP